MGPDFSGLTAPKPRTRSSVAVRSAPKSGATSRREAAETQPSPLRLVLVLRRSTLSSVDLDSLAPAPLRPNAQLQLHRPPSLHVAEVWCWLGGGWAVFLVAATATAAADRKRCRRIWRLFVDTTKSDGRRQFELSPKRSAEMSATAVRFWSDECHRRSHC